MIAFRPLKSFAGLLLMFLFPAQGHGLVAYKKSPNHPDRNARISEFLRYDYSDPRYRFFTEGGTFDVTRFQQPAIHEFVRIEERQDLASTELPLLQAHYVAAVAFRDRFDIANEALNEEIDQLDSVLKRLLDDQEKVDGLWLTKDDARRYRRYLAREQPDLSRTDQIKVQIQATKNRIRSAEVELIRAKAELRRLRRQLDAEVAPK